MYSTLLEKQISKHRRGINRTSAGIKLCNNAPNNLLLPLLVSQSTSMVEWSSGSSNTDEFSCHITLFVEVLVVVILKRW